MRGRARHLLRHPLAQAGCGAGDIHAIGECDAAPNGYANLLVVHPSLPVDGVRALIALAKARPGQLNYGASAVGGTPHLAGELFKSMAGIDIVRVSYKGMAQAVTGLIGGEFMLMFPTMSSGIAHVKSRRLNVEMVRVLQSASTRERLATGGLEAVGSSAEQFATAVKNDMTRMGKVIRDAGIQAQ